MKPIIQKIFFIALLMLHAFIIAAQTKPVASFTGGNGDGWACNNFIQPFNNIYTGGNSDGWATNSFIQPFNNIYNGGNGDGGANNSFTQPFNNIYTGGNGDGWASGYLPQAALPITMLSLTAQKQSNTAALIQWEINGTTNMKYFDVERSADAINYNYIGKVQASTNAGKGNYSFNDSHPLKGLNYYRLKQVAINNQVALSPSRLVKFDEAGTSIKCYPNPTNGILNVALTAQIQQEPAVLNIINSTGVVMDQVKITAGTHTIIQLNLSRYAKGTYLIQVKTASTNSVKKVVVQ